MIESPRTIVRGLSGEEQLWKTRESGSSAPPTPTARGSTATHAATAPGYRTRHHREHVEGDYKHPPPSGKYHSQYERSKKLLKQPPVVLSPEWRQVIGRAMVEMLLRMEAQLLCLSMSGQHLHLLAKMPSGPTPRDWIGRAKKHSAFVARDRGWMGKLWAVRSKIIPICDRKHQLNVFGYILRHADEGAWIWDFRNHQQSS